MPRSLPLAAWIVTVATSLVAQSPTPPFPRGELVPKVVARDRADQTYALYLPKAYDGKRRWPLLLAFCPGADGPGAVTRHQRAAETYGWIVAGSNVSKNGPSEPNEAAARVMLADVRARLSIDDTRLYACGISGGACVANWIAQSGVAEFAGVFLHARGDFTQVPKGPGKTFYLLAPGTTDFNLDESVRYLVSAEKVGATAVLDVQPGGHEWASETACIAFLRFAEIENAFASGAIDDRAAKLVGEEFDELATQLDGAFPWLAQRRLEALVARLPAKDRRFDALQQRWTKLQKELTSNAPDEQKAWDVLASTCQFDGAIDGRYPSVVSVQAVDRARCELLAQWTGTTAAELTLLSRQNTPVSLARAFAGQVPDDVKKAYEAVAAKCTDHGVKWLDRAKELLAKKPRRAIGTLLHGVRAGAVRAADVESAAFAKLKKSPAFLAVLALARTK